MLIADILIVQILDDYIKFNNVHIKKFYFSQMQCYVILTKP